MASFSSLLPSVTARTNAHAILDASTSNLNRSIAACNYLEFLSLVEHCLAATTNALPAGKLPDARLFAGATELYQYDYWSALKYVNGTQQVANAMTLMYTLANVTSSATAMVAALQRYGSDTSRWDPSQIECDGYWLDVSTTKIVEGVYESTKDDDDGGDICWLRFWVCSIGDSGRVLL
ncbi:hypothetical protein Cni_G25863 [Canna indica]|uniref:Uncharacterized protein n=1 Tax=Canna indica TaxID=4628 RepID=A0AAQ3KYE4_9LILI|nr:hypothetical protein Cni_G25863 [Canna indica]